MQNRKALSPRNTPFFFSGCPWSWALVYGAGAGSVLWRRVRGRWVALLRVGLLLWGSLWVCVCGDCLLDLWL